jgi:hypothetical protein
MAECCVYTIVEGEKLAGLSTSGQVARFDEYKP